MVYLTIKKQFWKVKKKLKYFKKQKTEKNAQF